MFTFVIGCAALVLTTWLILGAITVCSYLRSDRYPPEVAEAPAQDPDGVEKQFAEVGDTFGFSAATKAFDEVFNAIGPPPGWKPTRRPSLDEEIDDLTTRYRRGEDIESGAPREMA